MKIRVVLKFLALIALIITGFMTIAFTVSVFTKDGGEYAFTLSVAIGLASALAFYAFGRGADMSRMGPGDVFAAVTFAWIAASAISACPYVLHGAAPTYTDAFFESMSGFSTTGATIFPNIEVLPRSILIWRAITHWLGGMGIIGITLAMMPLIGVGGFRMCSAEAPGMTHEKITPRVRQTAIYLWLIYIGLTVVLVILLMFGGIGFFDAVNHSMSTISTGGFSTRTASVAYYHSAYFEWVITIFMFLSGANFVLHFHAIKGRSLGHYFKDPEFRFYAAVVLGMIALISADLFGEGRYVPFRDALRAGAFQVTSIITTTGFISADYERWPYFAKSIICVGLFLGGCAGSTAGGIKQVRLLAMTNCVRQRMRKMLNPRAVVMVPIGSSTLEPAVMSSCMAFFGLYFMVFAAGAFAISLFEPDLMTSIAGAATTLGNVWPAFGDLGATDNFSGQCPEAKWIFSFLMLCGRLELYTVFALFSGAFWREGIITGDGTD